MTSKISKIISLSLLALISSSTLSSCSIVKELQPLPDDQRYRRINTVLERIDYEKAGTIVKDEYDDGDGVFSSSSRTIQYKEIEAFDYISTKMTELSRECRSYKVRETVICDYMGVEVTYSVKDSLEYKSKIHILDTTNGR